MLSRKPRILIITDWYAPGWKAGGALRSIVNMVNACGDTFEFFVLTRDRDLGDCSPYASIESERWTQQGPAQVFYAKKISAQLIKRLVDEVCPDATYLNSFFSVLTIRYLSLRRLGLLPDVRVMVAPRGEFSLGAIRLKAVKKRLFVALSRFARLYSGVLWMASTEEEKKDIFRAMGINAGNLTAVANDIPTVPQHTPAHRVKTSGSCRFGFVSRISRKKNLDAALVMLAQANVPCSLEIYGMIEDEQYWRECQALIKRLPSHITVTHHGGVHPEHVQSAFASFHFFLFPTRGENFGHVIVESLLAGTPVLISDRTPWGALELASAGWCTPLSDVKRWVELLRACALMDDVKFQQHSRAASTFSGRWLAESGTDKQTEEMLRFLVR